MNFWSAEPDRTPTHRPWLPLRIHNNLSNILSFLSRCYSFFYLDDEKDDETRGMIKVFFFFLFSLSLSLSLRLPLLVRHETSPKRNGRFNFPMWTFERVERWSVYNVVCFFLSLRKEKRREKKGKERKRRVKEREGCSEKGKRSILVFFFERTYSLAVYRFISIFYHTRVYTTSIARIHVQSLCDPREEYNFSRVSYTVCMCFFFSVALRIQLCNEKNVFRENNYRRLIDFLKIFLTFHEIERDKTFFRKWAARKKKERKKKKEEEEEEAKHFIHGTIAYTVNHSSIKVPCALRLYTMFLIVCLYVCSYFCINLRDSLCSLPSLLSSRAKYNGALYLRFSLAFFFFLLESSSPYWISFRLIKNLRI